MSRAQAIRGLQRPPVADIEVILGKFSAWSSSQAASTKPRSRVADVSYEQALHATSFRRMTSQAAVTPEAATATEGASVAAAAKPASESRIGQAAAPAASAAGAEGAGVERKKRKRRAIPAATAAACGSQTPALSRTPAVKPSFAGVVEQRVAIATGEPAVQGRSVALSVRLTPNECALVKARAAEAQTSVSAYMRQCALEVDMLRDHVESALAELRAANTVPDSAARTQPAMNERSLAPSSRNPEQPGEHRGLLQWGIGVLRALSGSKGFEGIA